MNPNSANQNWSHWIWEITPGRTIDRPFQNVRENLARFGRKTFGSGSQMQLRHQPPLYRLEIVTEGHPVEDPNYVKFIDEYWQRFFENGFGPGTTSILTTKVLAGHSQDGKPREQWLMIGGSL